MRLLGLDPGLRYTGWGIVEATGNRLSHVADGVVHAREDRPLAERLVDLCRQLEAVLDRFAPEAAAVEETFVNKNPASTLKLGMARGIVLLVPAARGLPVYEYSANLVKKSVVGVGHADKRQVEMMVRRLLPGSAAASPDAADALAVAICHAHHGATRAAWGMEGRGHSQSLDIPLPSGRGQGERVLQPRSIAVRSSAVGNAPSPRPSPQRGEGDLRAQAAGKPTPAETARARRLRVDATDVERILWGKLRAGRLEDAKFQRREPVLGFTADFVCHERKLIIELDGSQHADKAEHDARRTRMFEQAGFRVLRFWNSEVIENIEGVLETIRIALIAPAELTT